MIRTMSIVVKVVLISPSPKAIISVPRKIPLIENKLLLRIQLERNCITMAASHPSPFLPFVFTINMLPNVFRLPSRQNQIVRPHHKQKTPEHRKDK